jgi:hypothetical protein
MFYLTNGVVDLNLVAKSLDPDDNTIDLALTGLPYGWLSSLDDPEAMSLRVPSFSNPSDPMSLMGCSQPDRFSPYCANLNVQVGKSQLRYSTGDKFEYATITTDSVAHKELAQFPFDLYQLSATAQVRDERIWRLWRSVDPYLLAYLLAYPLARCPHCRSPLA